MLQFDEYKVKLNNLKPELELLGESLDLESAERELDMLQAESASDGFWDNVDKARKVQQRISQLEGKVGAQQKRLSAWEDLMVLCEMGNEEEDESLVPELEEGPSGDPAVRRVRQRPRHRGFAGRRRRHRGSGLGPDALPYVHPLG